MPTARGIIFLLVVTAILLLGGMAAADQALEGSGTNTTTILNKSWTPDGGNYTTLQYSQNYSDYSNITVYDANVSVVNEPGNYSFNNNNGTIFTVNTSYLSNQSTAYIDYSFLQANNQSIAMFQIYQKSLGEGEYLLYLLIGGVFIALMKVLGGLT